MLDPVPQIASVAVFNGDKLLMGKRNDSKKWTLPGGHFEKNERPHEAAQRELEEETGIKAHQLIYLGNKFVTSELGILISVYSYRYNAEPDVTTEYDPDDEVESWMWVNTENGVPLSIMQNLHSPRNVTLELLGLSSMFYIPIEKSPSFVIDLFKADRQGPHKFLRKYKNPRTGKDIYIYHEGSNHGKQMDEGAVKKLRKLIDEHGHQPSKDLLDNAEKLHPDKIEHLSQLHRMGHEPATEHLRKIGLLKHVKQEKIEQDILAERNKDPYKRELDEEGHQTAGDAVEVGLKKIFDRLSEYETSAPTVALAEKNITKESLMEAMHGSKSINDYIKNLDAAMVKIDEAHEGVTSQFNEANDAGGYGNLAFNTAIQEMGSNGLIPTEAVDLIKRTEDNRGSIQGLSQESLDRMKSEARERRETAERRRADKERRAGRELEGSMASFVSSLIDPTRASGDTSDWKVQDTVKLHKAFKEIFGRNMRKEDWPYDFSEAGIEVKIESCSVGRNQVHFDLRAYKNGRAITSIWSRQWGKDGSKPFIYNSHLEVHGSMAGHGIGRHINLGQLKMMKAYAPNGYINVSANITAGGYTWANCGFKFRNPEDLAEKKRRFKTFLAEKGIELTSAEWGEFKYPHHFAVFDNGTTVRKNGRDMHLGQAFMAGPSWSGRIDIPEMVDGYEPYDHFMNYERNRNDRLASTNPRYRAVVEGQQQRPRSRARRSTGATSDQLFSVP